jgi:hypothetical protein
VIAQQATGNLKIVAEGKILSGIEENSQSMRSFHCGCNDFTPPSRSREGIFTTGDSLEDEKW